MKRIAIDMDEVIADAAGKHLELYLHDHPGQVTPEMLVGKSLREVVPEVHREVLEGYLRAADFFSGLEVIPDSQAVMQELSNRFEIFVTTAAMEYPTSFPAKYAWLKEHFPFVPDSHIVFCGDKGILHADYLIDDNARHFRRFVGQGILFSAPHNLHVTDFPRVSSWREVAGFFEVDYVSRN